MRAVVCVPDPGSRETVVSVLQSRGHEAAVADDAASAVARSESGPVDLVVLEANPDRPEDLEGIRRFKAARGDGWPEILALTRAADPGWMDALRTAGASAVLGEPPDRSALVGRLAAIEGRIASPSRSVEKREAAGGATERAFRPAGPPVGRYRSTPEGRFLEADQALAEILGYDSAEELARVDLERDVYVNPEVRHSILAVPGDDFHMVETDWKRKDGQAITVRISARRIRDDAGRTIAFDGVVEDVTRSRQAEAQLRAAIVYSPIATMVVDPGGRIVTYNAAAEALTGYGAEELPTMDEWLHRLHPDPSSRDRMQKLLDHGPRTAEEWIVRQGGQRRLIQFHLSSFCDGCVVQMLDITEPRRAGEAIRQKQEMLRQLIELHERDRQLMAYELHDGFCQQLAAVMMKLQAYQHLRDVDPEESRRCFESALGWLGQSITEARRLIGGLRPPILDESGVVAAVDYLVAEAGEDRGMQVLFNQNLGTTRLASPLETCLFRVIQEGVRNARRYSQSDRVQIDLFREGSEIVLTIRDWGVGFDPNQVGAGHFGIQGIRERARWLGGKAEIQSAPGQGTQITVRLPLVETVPEQPT